MNSHLRKSNARGELDAAVSIRDAALGALGRMSGTVRAGVVSGEVLRGASGPDGAAVSGTTGGVSTADKAGSATGGSTVEDDGEVRAV